MTGPTTFETFDELRAAAGRHLGYTDWIEIDQERVDLFAEATGDHQWIHVDVERATAESPFGGPIAHGYLTLSLSNLFLPAAARGAGRVGRRELRHRQGAVPEPRCRVGSRIRAGAEVIAVDEIAGGLQTTILITIEVEGSDKPACVIESLSRWMA